MLSLKDKYGKMGIIALLGYTVTQETLEIEDYVLSCRAAERSVEETMLYILSQHAKKYGVSKINLQAILQLAIPSHQLPEFEEYSSYWR